MTWTLHLPKELAHRVEGRPWLPVKYSDRPRLTQGKETVELQLLRSTDLKDTGIRRSGFKARHPGATPFVVGGFISLKLRRELEHKGVGYLSSMGQLHLPWSGGIIHVAEPSAPEPISSTLGVHGVRAVQAILDRPTEIQVQALARSIKLSLSGTHSVLKTLEREGLVRSTGSGPSTRRTVIDRARLIDWLAAQPAARRRERYVDAALYAKTPRDLWTNVSKRLDREGVLHGWTGAAAATALAAGPTSLPISTLRIDPDTSFDEVLTALKAEKTDRGANLRLVRDVGRLGSMATGERDGLQLAPLARIYLDLLAEKRGEAVAEHFREVALGY